MYLLSGGFDTNRHVEHEIQRDYKDFPFGCKGFGLTQPSAFLFSMWCKKRVWAFSHHSAMENPIPFYVFPFQWGHLPSLTTAHPLQRVTRSRGARFTRIFEDRPLGGSVEPVSVWNPNTAACTAKPLEKPKLFFCTVGDICRMFFFFFWNSIRFLKIFLYIFLYFKSLSLVLLSAGNQRKYCSCSFNQACHWAVSCV